MIAFLLTAVVSVSLASNIPSPAQGGQAVTITAQASGGSGEYEYRFFRLPMSDDGYQGVWSVVQEWSKAASFTYTSPLGGGFQMFAVWAREAGKQFTFDGKNGAAISFQINSAPLPTCGPLILSALGAVMASHDTAYYLPLKNKAYAAGSYAFPFVVPPGKIYNISSIHVKSKTVRMENGQDLMGGVILTNLFTINDETPLIFPTPLPMPGGSIIDGFFANPTWSEPMNQMILVVGNLTGPECGG